MSRLLAVFAVASVALLMVSCVPGPGSYANASNPRGTGPFDRNGNYIEQWADTPSKWGGRYVSAPPVTPRRETTPAPSLAARGTPPRTTTQRPQISTTTVMARAEPRTAPRTSSKPVTKATAKPKPKVVAKPKPTPSYASHTVRKGDTLSGLARRYGTTVAKIKSANGISGTIIQDGRRLKIPRK